MLGQLRPGFAQRPDENGGQPAAAVSVRRVGLFRHRRRRADRDPFGLRRTGPVDNPGHVLVTGSGCRRGGWRAGNYRGLQFRRPADLRHAPRVRRSAGGEYGSVRHPRRDVQPDWYPVLRRAADGHRRSRLRAAICTPTGEKDRAATQN